MRARWRNCWRDMRKLRVQVMHAGCTMIDNVLTLLQANSQVYVDIAGLIWGCRKKVDGISSG
jgi:hypothetical protein